MNKIPFLILIILLAFHPASTTAQATPLTYTFYVNSTANEQADANPGDGICANFNNLCSLHAAVSEANALGTSGAVDVTILLPRDTIHTSAGDLEITADSILIQTEPGTGAPATISFDGEIIISSGTLSIFDTTISDSNGLLLTNVDSRLSLFNSTLYNNSFTYANVQPINGGGAIFNAGILNISYCTLSGNSTNGNGGAIYNYRGQVHIDSSVFMNNSAANGGAIFNVSDFDAELHIQGSVFEGNSASGYGGALHLNGYNHQGSNGASSVFIGISRIRSNQAANGGGIYVGTKYTDSPNLFSHGGMNLVQSEVSGNLTTTGNGGGIYINGNTNIDGTDYIYIENSTLTGNEAFQAGGGLYVLADPTNATYLFNTTVTDNAADRLGGEGKNGGGYANPTGSSLQLVNSILAGNRDLTSGAFPIWIPDCVGTVNLQHSLLGYKQAFCTVETNSTGLIGTTSPLDARLGPRHEGGATVAWYHPLLSDSPAINAADPGGCKGIGNRLLTEDQNFNQRPRGIACDMGAIEAASYAVFLPAVLK